jgi:hypothetical protein
LPKLATPIEQIIDCPHLNWGNSGVVVGDRFFDALGGPGHAASIWQGRLSLALPQAIDAHNAGILQCDSPRISSSGIY